MQIETLLDCPLEQIHEIATGAPESKLSLSVSKLIGNRKPKKEIKSIIEVNFQGTILRELESGTIEIERNGVLISPTKPELRKFAAIVGVDILNENGNPRNTRQLGSLLINTIKRKEPNRVLATD